MTATTDCLRDAPGDEWRVRAQVSRHDFVPLALALRIIYVGATHGRPTSRQSEPSERKTLGTTPAVVALATP
jgi:hypothetical protein